MIIFIVLGQPVNCLSAMHTQIRKLLDCFELNGPQPTSAKYVCISGVQDYDLCKLIFRKY